MPIDHATLSWATIERLVADLADGLRSAGPPVDGEVPFDRIVAIARGGLVPAALLAAVLGVERVEALQVRFYEGTQRLERPTVLGPPVAPAGPSGDPRRTLVVDEMLDSGATLRFVADCLPGATLAVLVARGDGGAGTTRVLAGPEGPPVWAACREPGEAWLVFPWSPSEDRPQDGQP